MGPQNIGYRRYEPWVLWSGLSFGTTLAGHAVLDRLITPFGPYLIVGAALCAILVGGSSALLLGRLTDPPDMAGGGLMLGLLVVGSTVTSLIQGVVLPPTPFWSAVWDVLHYRAMFAPLVAAAAIPGVLLPLALKPDEVFEDGRFRRASGYWLSAWAPPAMAWLLLMPRGAGMVYWFILLVSPLLLFLGAVGVRVREEVFHQRRARARLALVSTIATLVLVALGTVRQVAG